jgi:hypothetical protein
MNILPVGAELFHADGRTDVAKLTVTSCNFANALKNGSGVYNTTFDLTAMFLLAVIVQYQL